MKFFIFDGTRISVNDEGLLVLKEFKALLDRDVSRAFREFTYIYLAIDWQSPYSEFSEYDKMLEAKSDANLTEEEFNDPLFREACRKYVMIQDENWSMKCLQSAQNAMSKFIDYFNNIDPEERDLITGKPVYKVKDIMTEIKQLSDLNEALKKLKYQVKKEKEEESSIRGGEEDGYIPGF